MTFGPGAAVVAFGVVVFLVRDVFVALPYVILGVALILTAGTQVSAYRAGYERGLAEGRTAGREDKDRNQGWDLEGQRELEQADSGYTSAVGARSDYQAGYRAAFRVGYREGYGPRRPS